MRDTLYRCTVCGREGRVGRCCGDETRAPLNDLAKKEQATIKLQRRLKMELKENVKEKLAEAVELWADENLIGKPAILANAIYFSLEKVLIDKAKEIQEKF